MSSFEMYKKLAYLIKNNYNFEIIDFFKNINDYKYGKKFLNEISNDLARMFSVGSHIYKIITNYIVLNHIDIIYPVSKEELYKLDVYINDILVTEDIIDNVFKYIEVYNYPKINYVYCDILKKYLNNEIDMDKLRKKEERLDLIKIYKR